MLTGKKNLSRFLLFVGYLAYASGIVIMTTIDTQVSQGIPMGWIYTIVGSILISWVMIDFMSNKKK